MLPALVDLRDKTDIQKLYPQGATLLQSQAISMGIELAHYRHPPTDLPANICQQHLILINTNVPIGTQVEQFTDGYYQTGEMKNEDIIIIPAGMTHSARWNKEHSYLAVSIDPEAFEQRLGNAIAGHSVELMPHFLLPDALLYNIGMAFKAELEASGFGGQLYVDSLATTLSAHLLRNYCTHKISQAVVLGGLPKYKLRQVIEYIHAHINQDISLAELAGITQVSPNYFATQFKQSTGFAPHEYVIYQRIERAKKLLGTEKMTLADVAHSLGFTHQSHFTRHFKRLVGVTPKQFLNQQ